MSVFSKRPWTCPQCVHCTDTVFSVSILPSVLCSVESVFQTLWPSLCTDNFLLDPRNLEGSYLSKYCLHRWLGLSLELLLPASIEDVLGLLSSMSSFVLSSHEVFCLEIFFFSQVYIICFIMNYLYVWPAWLVSSKDRDFTNLHEPGGVAGSVLYIKSVLVAIVKFFSF